MCVYVFIHMFEYGYVEMYVEDKWMCVYLQKEICISIIYIYMVIDLKVPVKSFICEDRSCYVGNPCDFSRARESNIVIRESCYSRKFSRKLDIMNHIVYIYNL